MDVIVATLVAAACVGLMVGVLVASEVWKRRMRRGMERSERQLAQCRSVLTALAEETQFLHQHLSALGNTQVLTPEAEKATREWAGRLEGLHYECGDVLRETEPERKGAI